ncbi:MAG: MarC family protein [Steroidobacteraceae bacterium]
MNGFLKVLLASAVLVPATLLPIINPLAGAPIFLAVTGGHERLTRVMARRVAINCFFLLVGALLVGGYVLDFFGLSIPIVRVAGGLVVAAAGWRMLNDPGEDAVQRSVADSTGGMSETEIAQRSFMPMSFPLTVGPGTIAATIALGSKRPSHAAELLPQAAGALIGLTVSAAVVYLTYRYSGNVLRKLGTTGTMVLMRLAAFILLCIGIDILWSGASELLALHRG